MIRLRNIRRFLGAFAALVLFAAAPAHASALLGNLGSSHDGVFFGTPYSADDFTTGNIGLNITSIDIFWDIADGGTSNRVGIFQDSAGLPSTTQVGGWFTNAAPITDNTVISYAGGALLSALTTYWMVVDISDGSDVGFSLNQVVFSDPSTQGATINGPNPGSAYGTIQPIWNSDPANLLYRLNGTAVPEPSTAWLAALGLIGMAAGRRRTAARTQ